MDERAKITPGLPRSESTKSYWQKFPSAIADLRSTPDLPKSADYIIVGSGITGACTAYNILSKNRNATVVILEARQASSGATGRNGGHTKGASYRAFLDNERQFGIAEAISIARLEYNNIIATHEFAKKHGIDCASTPCQTVDAIYSESTFKAGCEAIARMKQTMGEDDPAANYLVHDKETTAQSFHLGGTYGSFEYEAGSISAYDFTIGVLQLALSKGLNLQTTTPATQITAQTATSITTGGKSQTLHQTIWTVNTPRGTITTNNLILATNGYTAHLVPQLLGSIVPLHGQIIAHRPAPPLSPTGMTYTYSLIRDGGYEYMITRPPGSTGAGDVIIGGGLWTSPGQGLSRYGETNDSKLEPMITNYLRECVGGYFGGPATEEDDVKAEWSGIMGATPDGLPFVGPVPGLRGLWVAAGFNGHGMVWCLKAAEAVVGFVMGSEEEKRIVGSWFPARALITKERMGLVFEGRTDLREDTKVEARRGDSRL